MDKAIKIFPPEDVERMFARLGKLRLDTGGVRRKFLNCPYGEESPRQALDIYLPNEGDGPFPIVFFIHGGGWSGGAKNDNQLVSLIDGVNRGYAVVSIGYRLIPHIRYPENLFDIKAALRWIAGNAETYLLDPSRTALTGASAGAHLALMAAFTAGQPCFDKAPFAQTCKIRAVVDQFGPSDFSKMHTHYDESGYARAQSPDAPSSADVLLGVKTNLVPNLLRFINPIDNVHHQVPPVLAFHGKYDPIVPYQQSVELCAKINEIAGEESAEVVLSDEFLHADPGYAGEESVSKLFTFLDKYLK